MKLTVKSGGVPPGSYVAKFQGVEPKESQYGKGLIWTFEVQNGTHAGAKATAMTGDSPTSANKCGKFLAGITGKPLAVGQSIDLAQFVGKSYLIVCEATDKGGSKVASVSLPPTA